MTIRLNPYLSFGDDAADAMAFYQSVLGGDLMLSKFSDFDPSSTVPDGIMHAHLTTPDGLTLMGADTPPHMGEYAGQVGVSVSLSGDDEDKLRGYWNGLSDGATVMVPLEAAPWGAIFGMLVDKFGTSWLVNIGEQ